MIYNTGPKTRLKQFSVQESCFILFLWLACTPEKHCWFHSPPCSPKKEVSGNEASATYIHTYPIGQSFKYCLYHITPYTHTQILLSFSYFYVIFTLWNACVTCKKQKEVDCTHPLLGKVNSFLMPNFTHF